MDFLVETYRQAYLSVGQASSWESSTVYLYYFIVVVVAMMGWQAEKKNGKKNGIIRFCFVFLLIFLGLRGYNVGSDTKQYAYTFMEAESLGAIFNDGASTEPVYKILQFCLRQLFADPHLCIFVYSFATLFFISSTLNRYSRYMSIYIAVLSFVCIYYFQSFNLMRINLAASFMLWNFHYLEEGNFKRYAMVILGTTFLHYSTICMYLPLGLYWLYRKNKVYALWFITAFVGIVVFATKLFGEYVMLIERYQSYVEDNEGGSHVGVMLFVDYLPCLYVAYYLYKNKITGLMSDLMMCFTMSAFSIRLIAYFLSAAGRLNTHMMSLLIILLPYWIAYLRNNDRRKYKTAVLLCTVWAFFRLHVYFKGYLAADDIMPYYFFWND